MPDLEAEIAAWRGRMSAALPDQPATVQELEEHLRDHLEALRREGMSGAAALAAAVTQLGDVAAVGREFRRTQSRWFGAVHSWEKKVLAYCAALLGLVGFMCFFTWSVWALTRLLNGKRFGPNPALAAFWIFVTIVLTAVCALAMRAGGRFLERPTRADARNIAAFTLLAVWILGGTALAGARFSYAGNVTVLVLALGGLLLLWRAWTAHVMRSHFPATTARA
jgi:hypothetical protein